MLVSSFAANAQSDIMNFPVASICASNQDASEVIGEKVCSLTGKSLKHTSLAYIFDGQSSGVELPCFREKETNVILNESSEKSLTKQFSKQSKSSSILVPGQLYTITCH